jgi:hypothetical protein
MGTLVMAGAIGIMGMDAARLPLLWLYSVCATTAREDRRPGLGSVYPGTP